MARTGVRWTVPPSVLVRNMELYEQRLYAAVGSLFAYYAPIVESHAKAGAPWTDRTGNARQSLFSVADLGTGRVVLYLSHGVSYGVFLELRYQGRYAIIMRTLNAYYGVIMGAVKEMLQ